MKNRILLLMIAALAGVPVLFPRAVGAQVSNEELDQTRDLLDKWVDTRRTISKEKSDFELSKEMLNERIDVVQQEIDSLQAKIKEAQDSIGEADKKRSELMEENEKLKDTSSSLNEKVVQLEHRLKELLVRLPDPIRERVKPLSQRIAEDGEESKLSLSERFQNIIGILNEINKFNREITVTSEVRELPNGNSAEVTALYVGIGQGYYANAKGDVAGRGTATDTGWVWKPAPDAAKEITEAIAILKNEAVASFVQLPVEVN